MKVSIIIINYNTFKLTAECISSIIACTKAVDYEIIVVDNASTKDNPDEFLKLFPSIKLIKSTDNGGFAKGNNQGIAAANGDIILLLNSDTYLTEDSVAKAVSFLTKHPEAGIITTRLVYPDGKVQHYARKFRYIWHELLDLLRPLLFLLPYKKRATLMLNQYYNSDFDTEADWVGAAFFMFRKNLLADIGGKLDERYFMYGEDQLWCYQVQQAGYKIWNYTGTTVVHIEGASSAKGRVTLNKVIIERELDIVAIRKGKGLYYQIFRLIFLTKKYTAYYMKKLLSIIKPS